jgi:hypothetical protein
LQDYGVLGEISSLKKIMLTNSGEIKSLSFINKLPNLKFISFVNTNVKDGDLSYCEGIEYVGFNNKKHYNYKSEDFRRAQSNAAHRLIA